MKLHCHRLLALILSLSFGWNAWAGGGTAPLSPAPPCQRTDCRPGHSQAVRVQGALLQAAALSVASGVVGPQSRARPSKGLPRRSQTRLPSWYKRSQAAQLRGQSSAVAASVPQKMPTRARVREAAASHPGRQQHQAAGPAADIPDLTSLSEDHERQDDPRLQAGEGEAVFGLRPPATDSHPGENHIMIGNVSGNISSNHSSNAPARVRGGGLSHSGARAVWHAATTLSLASPRRAAPGRSGKSRTAVPTRPHEQLSVAGLRQKDVGRRKSGVRVRGAAGGVQTAHAGKKGKVKDRTQPARPAGGRTGSTAAAVNPFESASSMKTAGPRSEARGAHHRHLVQESMDIEQDALDRQMRDLDLDDDVDSMAPDETMAAQGEELYSTAGPEPEKAREKRTENPCDDMIGTSESPIMLTADNLTLIRNSGVYTIKMEENGSISIPHPDTSLCGGVKNNFAVTLVNSSISAQGSLTFFDRLSFDIPISLIIQNSALIAGNGITLANPGGTPRTETAPYCNITLKIENQSDLQAQGGNITFLHAANCNDPKSRVRIYIDGKSKLSTKNGDINLVDSLNSTTLDIKINDSDLHAKNGSVVLVRNISGAPSTMTLSMNNSNLTASGSPHGAEAVLRAVPVGSVMGDEQTIRIENSHGNRIEARLIPTEQTPRTRVISSLGGISEVPCSSAYWDTHRLEQSSLTDNNVRAIVEDAGGMQSNNHAAYASLAGLYQHESTAYCPHVYVHSLHLAQSQLEGNSVKAQAQQGTSQASLGFARDAANYDPADERLDIYQEGCDNNRVAAISDGVAVASLALVEDCESMRPRSAESSCISTADPGRRANCSKASITLHQCAMEGNQLSVTGKSPLTSSTQPGNAFPSLLVSGGCLTLPLSVSGTGELGCNVSACHKADPLHGNIVSQADCRVLACGDQTPCTQGGLDAPAARLENPDAAACVDAFFSGAPRFSACKANSTPEDSTPSAPGEDNESSESSVAALATITGILVPVSGALLGAVVCLACRDKKRNQQAQYPVQDVMAMESRFVGEQAAAQAQAAAEPSAVQWHKGDGPLDAESDEETSSIARENLYEGVKGSPSAHF